VVNATQVLARRAIETYFGMEKNSEGN